MDVNRSIATIMSSSSSTDSSATTVVTTTTKEEYTYSWKLLDLWDNFDEELLERFYDELLLPNYKKEELELLDYWFRALTSEARDNPLIGDLHVLLAFKNAPTRRNSIVSSTISASPSMENMDGVDQTTTITTTTPAQLPQFGLADMEIEGAIMFEYYPDINCGLFNYLIIQNYRKNYNKGLDTLLIDTAIKILDGNATERGHLAGCNVIFFETKASDGHHQTQIPDVLDPRHQHAILHSMGFRMVDFDYVHLPLRKLGKAKNMLLTAYLTPHIPKMPFDEGDKYYLPSRLVKNFIQALWYNAFETGRLKDLPEEDPDYLRSIQQIEIRDKIPLLDLPWGEGKPWTLVDMWEDYDEELVRRFHDELMRPNFRKGDLEPINNWITALSPEGRESPYVSDLHVLLALKWPQQYKPGETKPLIEGGCVFEYHPENNCGLLTYLLLKPDNRVENLEDLLVESALEILDQNAKSRGNLAGCNVIFLEAYFADTNASPPLSDDEEGRPDGYAPNEPTKVLDITQNHTTLSRLGFRLVSFEYVMPPFSLEQGKSTQFLLTVYMTPLVPSFTSITNTENGTKYFLPSVLLKQFVQQQWINAYGSGHMRGKPEDDPDFQRMIKQLSLRDKIPLLDIPWESGTWTFVDMWEDFDRELLTRFYQELMVPNFPNKDELETLESWMTALEPNLKEDPDVLDLHILMALKWPSSDARRGTQPIIDGCCVFEYYRSNNCGLLSYLVTRKKDETLYKQLVERCIEILDQNAQENGHMSGCNCIFWEANVEEQVSQPHRPLASHSFSHRMGFRQLDFQYIMPPMSPSTPKVTNYLLTVYLDVQIPRMPFEEEGAQKYYLPSVVLKNFIQGIWQSAYATGRIKDPPEADPDYVMSIQQIEIRDKIPLLDLPWTIKPFTLVDLWEDYDEDLARRFYYDLMIPNFPIEGELEPFETWLKILRREKGIENQVELHIILALRWQDRDANGQPLIGGGITAEYYPTTNCGLLTYLVVHKRSRGQGLAGILVGKAVQILDKNARKRGKLAGCNSVFLETNSAEKVTPQQDVMDPRMRHTIYHKMGFRLIDFQYVMPPLAPNLHKLKILLLTVYLTPHIPKMPLEEGDKYCLPSVLLKRFVEGQWAAARAKGNLLEPPEKDIDFVRSIQQIQIRDLIPLRDLPWGGGKPWTLVDMWEDYDEEMVEYFYKNYMMPRFGSDDGLEPLENWLAALSNEGRENPDICDLHVLLAFKLSDESDDSPSATSANPNANVGKNIVGGLVFEYYPSTNCALMTYVVVNNEGNVDYNKQLSISLLKRAVKIVDQNAKSHGHIAGCNCIFLEAPFKTQEEAKRYEEEEEDDDDVYLNRKVDPLDHHFLYDNGFRMIDFKYFQPPFNRANPRSRNVCLTVFVTPRIPKFKLENMSSSLIPASPSSAITPRFERTGSLKSIYRNRGRREVKAQPDEQEQHYIPAALMHNFITTLWADECGLAGYSYEQDENYRNMLKQLEDKDFFPILDNASVWTAELLGSSAAQFLPRPTSPPQQSQASSPMTLTLPKPLSLADDSDGPKDNSKGDNNKNSSSNGTAD